MWRAGGCLGEDFADLAGKDLTCLCSVVLQLFVHKVYKTLHFQKVFCWHIVGLQCCVSFGVQQGDSVIHTRISTLLLKKELFYLSVYIDYTGFLLPRFSLVAASESYSLHHSVRASHCSFLVSSKSSVVPTLCGIFLGFRDQTHVQAGRFLSIAPLGKLYPVPLDSFPHGVIG